MAAHFLRPGGKVSVPKYQVCVGYLLRRIPGKDDREPIGRYEISEATLKAWELRGNVWEMVNSVHVLQSAEFLHALQSLLRPASTTWVWATYMHRLLSCAGWYISLETGDWCITATRHAGADVVDKSGKGSWKGYLNCNERSFTSLTMHAASGRVALLCDTRNYDVLPGNGHGSSEFAVDCVSSWAAGLCNLVRNERLGQLRPSAAGTAVAAFKQHHINSPVLCHGNRGVASLERAAYWPGRCECFRVGIVPGPIYHLDIASAYPSVTRKSLLPTRLRGFFRSESPAADILMEAGWLAIADCTVRSQRRAFPSLHAGKTIWPIGLFRTVLCGPELADAYANGEVVKQHAVAIYSGHPALASWSEYWLELRDREDVVANPYLRKSVKCITNRLYGCFAKRNRQWLPCRCNPPRAAFDQWYQEPRRPGHDCGKYLEELRQHDLYDENVQCGVTQWRSVAWDVEYMTAPEDSDDACVAISAFVSSLARVLLFRYLSAAGITNTVYCDTDSLFVTAHGHRNLEVQGLLRHNGPGFLRLVGAYPGMLIRSPKNYDVGTTTVHAGSPANAVIGSDGKYTWDECESVYSALRQGIAPSGRVAGRTRRLPEAYLPGSYGPDGTVYPVLLGEG